MATFTSIVNHIGVCQFESGYSHVTNFPFDYNSYATRESDRSFVNVIGTDYMVADIVSNDEDNSDTRLRLVAENDPELGIFSEKIVDTRHSIAECGEYYRFETENGTVWNLWVPRMDEVTDF